MHQKRGRTDKALSGNCLLVGWQVSGGYRKGSGVATGGSRCAVVTRTRRISNNRYTRF